MRKLKKKKTKKTQVHQIVRNYNQVEPDVKKGS